MELLGKSPRDPDIKGPVAPDPVISKAFVSERQRQHALELRLHGQGS